MKSKIYLWSMVLLMVLVTSCREESDTVYNYTFDDGLNFDEAANSYAGKFKVLWKALNQNYAIWDYERDLGLDWDAVYDEFLPKYEALDKRTDVTDAELTELLTETVAPLHDGHFAAQMQNHQTGSFVMVSPSNNRVAKRPDCANATTFYQNLKLDLDFYRSNGDIVEYQEINASNIGLISLAYKTEGKCYLWAKDEVERLNQQTSLTDLEQFQLTGLQSFINEFDQMISLLLAQKLTKESAAQLYNQLVAKYNYLEIPGLNAIHSSFSNCGIYVKYALFKNNVAYLYIDGFYLTPYMTDESIQHYFGGADAATMAIVNEVHDIWQSWHQKIQTLHASGQLRGVIVDVRSDGGGMLSDYPYVFGSLVASGGFEIGNARFKRGLGRYDYSPIAPARFPTMDATHTALTEPVVVLCNSGSVSMAEITSLSCKVLPNGTLIGMPTHGGVCALHGNPKSYTADYAGIVGTQNVTPVWLYIPTMVTMSKEGQIFEGVGITPDILVDYDPTLFSAQGRDSQLDRALQFLNTGN